MTERKPPGVSWESWVDKQIHEARERGEFDNLPGCRQADPGNRSAARRPVVGQEEARREKVGFTPGTMALRREVEAALERIAEQTSEVAVRQIVTEVNQRIREANSKVMTGPASTLVPLDVEQVVRKWRSGREEASEALKVSVGASMNGSWPMSSRIRPRRAVARPQHRRRRRPSPRPSSRRGPAPDSGSGARSARRSSRSEGLHQVRRLVVVDG